MGDITQGFQLLGVSIDAHRGIVVHPVVSLISQYIRLRSLTGQALNIISRNSGSPCSPKMPEVPAPKGALEV
jgi:hypothetical protein